MFQETVIRNRNYCRKTIVVSNEEQYFLCLDQIEEIDVSDCSFILEPVGRNTAPAIALACMGLAPDDLVFVTPSDHLILNQDGYAEVLKKAKRLAEDNYIITFGIVPEYPETGFGYIEGKGNDVVSFKEKPSKEVALKYIEKGNYYWNSGMFLFKAGVMIEELKKNAPQIYEESKNAYNNAYGDGYQKIRLEDMLNIPADSIDYAVMEKHESK